MSDYNFNSEGYAVSINQGTLDSDRGIVAVFRNKDAAVSYIECTYERGKCNPSKPEIDHVFFGVEPF
jgi:hypothetical protein